ncbi:MAG: SAP domain-containing protein [Verrucomicrobia bacterium]|nr:SAP domain-containing protein [Verrucomicrobiota bacterium]
MSASYRVAAEFGKFSQGECAPLLHNAKREGWLKFTELPVANCWSIQLEVLQTPPRIIALPKMPALVDPDIFEHPGEISPPLQYTDTWKSVLSAKAAFDNAQRLDAIRKDMELSLERKEIDTEKAKDIIERVKEVAAPVVLPLLSEELEEREREEEENAQPTKKRKIESSQESEEDISEEEEEVDPSNIIARDRSQKYDNWRQPALRAECRRRNLTQRGTNEDLRNRLIEDDMKKSPVKKRYLLKKRDFADTQAIEVPDDEISESEEEEKEF